MTPHELAHDLAHFRKTIGPRAHVTVMITSSETNGGIARLNLAIDPEGLLGKTPTIYVKAPASIAFDEIIPLMEAAWLEHGAAHREALIKKMALAIIRLTSDRGQCEDYALRMEFSSGEVDQFGAQAEARANEIAGKGPFSITKSGRGSNGAPQIDMVA
jgi:hypothetical protein